jgi:glycosyltransferase involved in cell wall biosynthesis
MRICHVNLAGGFSGGERQTVNLIRELAGRQHQQTLVARPGSRLFDELAGLPGLEFRSCKHFLLGHTAGAWDLIHCHDGKAVYWAYLERRLRKTPYLITRRVDNPLGKGRFTRAAYTAASRVVCLSNAIARSVLARVASATIAVIPSSFSGFEAVPADVSAIRQRFAGKRLVGQVGRLLEHKGYQVTIAAAQQLAANYPDVMFVFLGEGPDEDWLKQQAGNACNVCFVGHQNNVGSWLAALEVFVFPSLHEGLGSTVLDAMQHGVPVIGARAGGIPDLIAQGETGLLVAPGDASDLARAIAGLLDSQLSREVLSDNATAQLEAFSPSTIAGRYQNLYTAVCTA